MRTVLAILNHSLPLAARFELLTHNHPHPDLTILGIGSGPRGLPAISVFHHRERGGRPLRHPEMRFEVEVRSGVAADLLPFCWLSEYDELEEHSVSFEGLEPNGKRIVRVDLYRLADQLAVARAWDARLETQGFERAYCSTWLLPQPMRVAHA